MLKFVFRKMLNKKWMILSLLIGNVFLISIAMSGPMYVDAVTQNLLTRTLTDSYRETGEYPALFTMEAGITKGGHDSASYQKYLAAEADMAALPETLGTAALYETEYSCVANYSAKTTSGREDESDTVNLSIAMLTGLEDHIELVEGNIYSAEPDSEGVYDALISRTAFVRKRLVMGEVLAYDYVKTADGTPLKLRVAGVFDSTDDPWWIHHESYYATELFIPGTLFDELFMGGETQTANVTTIWATHIDYESMRAEDAEAILSTIRQLNKKYNMMYIRNFNASCEEML